MCHFNYGISQKQIDEGFISRGRFIDNIAANVECEGNIKGAKKGRHIKMEKFKELIGKEINLCDLSNKLVAQGCEDIGWFGNFNEILFDGSMVVATDATGENHIIIYFDVLAWPAPDDTVLSAIIKIASIERF